MRHRSPQNLGSALGAQSCQGSAHESALYAPLARTNAEFKERIKADDTDATRWLSPTVNLKLTHVQR
jgi:hypothetical protein